MADRRLERNDFPTVVEDGVVYALLPLFRDSEHPVPDEMFVLGEWETPLYCVRATVPVARGRQLSSWSCTP